MLTRAGAVVVLAIAILAIAQPALPIQPSYATSGSMEPAIDTGDLYLVERTDDIETGDVVTFYSLRRGKYITHRVVDETAEGYVTQGDRNPSTDQASGLPPVDRSMLVGKVIEFNGQPVTFGGFGSIAAGLQAYRLPLLALAFGLILAPMLLPGAEQRRPTRDVLRGADVIRPLFIGALILCLVLPFVGASSHELLYVATEPGEGPARVVPVGESVERTITVETWVPPFTTTVVDAEGVAVLDKRVVDDGVELTIRVPAAETTGSYRAHVQVRPYPATLPASVLERLNDVGWGAALFGALVPVFAPLWAAYVFVVDGMAPIRPPRSRWLHRWGD